MKHVEELGISPRPWKVDAIGDPGYPVVKCGDGLVLQHSTGVWCLKDALPEGLRRSTQGELTWT